MDDLTPPPPAPPPAPRLTRRRFLAAGALSAAGAGLGALYGFRLELHWLEVVRRRLPIANLPPALEGRTLLHMSDLHAGPHVDDAYLLRVFRKVEELAPDLLVVTGDFVTGRVGLLEKAERIYAHLPRGRIATLGILGNHDYGRGWSHPEFAARLIEILAPRGIEILRNQVRVVEGLQIAGLDDFWGPFFDPRRALDRLDPARPMLALSHNPDSADRPVWRGFQGWILSGHTHGGQVRLPPFPPPIVPVANRRYAAGTIALTGGRRMYVSRGVGHLYPVRFGVRPEITVFTLTKA